MSGSPVTGPSRKRPRTEELAGADPTKPADGPDWTPLDGGKVSKVLEGETAQGKSQTEDEFEDDDMHMDEGGFEDRVRARDADFWFEDGMGVLVADVEGVEFRVYKGLLADHSPVLGDMFMFSGEDDGDDEHDGARENRDGEDGDANSNAIASDVDADATSNAGLKEHSDAASDANLGSDSDCPIVELTDAADDLRHILRAFLPNRDPTPYSYESPSFDAISASIRLGTKYQMPRLVQHALDYLELKGYYPASFDVWRKQIKGPPGFTARHAIGVVSLARLTGEDSRHAAPRRAPHLLRTQRGGRVGVKARGRRARAALDIELCFRAKGKLIEAALVICLRICSWKKTSPRCASKMKAFSDLIELRSSHKGSRRPDARPIGQGDECRDALRSAMADLPRRVRALCGDGGGSGLLLSFEKFYGDLRDQLCKECWAMVQDRDLAERRETWNRLPELLGITVDGWGRA